MSVVTKRLIIIAAIVVVAFILESYGLVVYLHAGGFTSGDKNADTKMLQWLCEKGYVAADRRGIRWRWSTPIVMRRKLLEVCKTTGEDRNEVYRYG